MILMGPLQLEIFYDSMISHICQLQGVLTVTRLLCLGSQIAPEEFLLPASLHADKMDPDSNAWKAKG